jgi:hypothetical protein
LILRSLCFSAALFTTGLYADTTCPPLFNNLQAIHIAEHAMDAWFSGVEKGDVSSVSALFSPQAMILHSTGAPLTRDQEMALLKGFHLGGYQFTDFCAVQNGDVIVASFASKTFKQDVSQSGLNFLSTSPAYRMVVLQKVKGHWLIVGYANTNHLKQTTGAASS